MKKIVLFICAVFLFLPFKASAISASASISGPINISTGDTFNVVLNMYISDYGNVNGVHAINGSIKYNSSLVEIVNSDSSLASVTNPIDDKTNYKFNLASNNGFTGGKFLTVTFKAKKSGNALFELSNCSARFGTDITALLAPSYSLDIKQGVTTASTKSNNTNLKNISISGYDIGFEKNKTTYRIDVGSNVNMLDVLAISEHSGASIEVSGNENFKIGENEISIIVTAEDGSKKEYIIIVNKKDMKSNSNNDVNSSDNIVQDDTDPLAKYDRPATYIFIVLIVALVILLIWKGPKKKKYKRKH